MLWQRFVHWLLKTIRPMKPKRESLEEFIERNIQQMEMDIVADQLRKVNNSLQAPEDEDEFTGNDSGLYHIH